MSDSTPAARKDRQMLRRRGSMLQQRALPNPGLADHQQVPALPRADGGQELIELGALAFAAPGAR